MSVFRQAREEQRYNLFLLEQYQLAEGQIYGKHASKESVTAMVVTNPNFIAEQCAIYKVVRTQATVRHQAAATETQLQAIATENNAMRLLRVVNELWGGSRWDDDCTGANISITDLIHLQRIYNF